MKSFELFLSLLATIPDPRRAEGKLYQLPHVLLFSILAVASGANSYRGLRTFIRVHRQKLNEAFAIDWKKAPAHTSELRRIFGDGVNQAADFFSDATSIPSRNVTPLTTFGN